MEVEDHGQLIKLSMRFVPREGKRLQTMVNHKLNADN